MKAGRLGPVGVAVVGACCVLLAGAWAGGGFDEARAGMAAAPRVRIGEPYPLRSAAGEIRLTAEARTTGPTGVEMEALTAVAVAALTVYDMVKGIERGAEIASVMLLEKSGGRSGTWRR